MIVTPAAPTSAVKQGNEGTKLSVTQTGILSNRRPIDLTDTATGVTHKSGRAGVDLLVLAKREGAKRLLYSRFHRGGVVNYEEETMSVSVPVTAQIPLPVAARSEMADGKSSLEETNGLNSREADKVRRKEEKRKRKGMSTEESRRKRKKLND